MQYSVRTMLVTALLAAFAFASVLAFQASQRQRLADWVDARKAIQSTIEEIDQDRAFIRRYQLGPTTNTDDLLRLKQLQQKYQADETIESINTATLNRRALLQKKLERLDHNIAHMRRRIPSETDQ